MFPSLAPFFRYLQHRSGLTLSDLNDDIFLEICDYLTVFAGQDFKPALHYVKHLSLVNRRIRYAASRRLFRNIVISAKRDRRNGDWEHGNAAILTFLKSDHYVLGRVKGLKFNIYTGGVPYEPISAQNISNLVKFLRNLPNLRSIEIYLPQSHAAALRDRLPSPDSKDPICFSEITTVTTNTFTAFIIDRCPNVDQIRVEQRPRAVYRARNSQLPLLTNISEPLSNTKHLTHFEAQCMWTSDELRVVIECCPRLQRLFMACEPSYTHRLPEIFSLLGHGLKELRRLDISDHEPTDPYAYRYSSSEQEQDQVQKQRARKEQQLRNAEIAFSKITNLETLWIGEKTVVTKVTVEGEPKLEWIRYKHVKRAKASFVLNVSSSAPYI